MKDQLTEQEYELNLLYLRSTQERQKWSLLHIEDLEKKGCKRLIPIILRVLITESRKQISLSEQLITQIQAL